MATRPPNTVMIAMTMATVGRRMKNLDIASTPFPRHREWLGLHDRAIGRATAFHDDARAGLQPLLNNPPAADAVADLHRFRTDSVVRADHPELKRPLQLADGALGHEQRVRAHARFGPDAAVLSRPQDLLGVGKRRADADRAGLRVDLVIRSEERPPPREPTSCGHAPRL